MGGGAENNLGGANAPLTPPGAATDGFFIVFLSTNHCTNPNGADPLY